MNSAQAAHFRDELRAARAAVLVDAEAYAQPLHVLERLGRFLCPGGRSLARVSSSLGDLADESPLCGPVAAEWPQFHRPFRSLLETVRRHRNDVMHVGARARHLTTDALEACLILEDALQQSLDTVADFMVPNPVVAEHWQPVSLVRLRMLESSFTFLPLRSDKNSDVWRFIADHHVARFLRTGEQRSERSAMTIETAMGQEGESALKSEEAQLIDASASVSEAIETMTDQPLLVRAEGRVVGIITAFDLL